MSEPSISLGSFEEIVLMAVHRLGMNKAYGVSIRQTVAEATGRDVSIGAIYSTLDRLKAKGYLESWEGEVTKERGGRAKKYFQVIGAGEEALAAAEAARKKLQWMGGQPDLKPV